VDVGETAFCLSRPFLSYSDLAPWLPIPQKRMFGDNWDRLFVGKLPFLSRCPTITSSKRTYFNRPLVTNTFYCAVDLLFCNRVTVSDRLSPAVRPSVCNARVP